MKTNTGICVNFIMRRKEFVTSILPLAACLRSGKIMFENEPLRPPYLVPGDVIGIISPAGSVTIDELQPAIGKMKQWGFQVKVGSSPGKKDNSRGGTDEERLKDFQQMLDDPSVKAIMCARGGYGSLRIIDQVNFDRFCKFPKWIIGFSDITVIHAHINSRFGVGSIHSKMCNSFPADWQLASEEQIQSIESIRRALTGEKNIYSVPGGGSNISGNCEGILVGGNLKVLENLACTRSDLITDDKILFLEDTGEYLYNIDRMFWNLKRTGKLDKLKGLIIGNFKIKPDDPGEEFGKTLEEIVLEKLPVKKYPVVFGFPVGHQKANVAIKCGLPHRLTVGEITTLQDL